MNCEELEKEIEELRVELTKLKDFHEDEMDDLMRELRDQEDYIDELETKMEELEAVSPDASLSIQQAAMLEQFVRMLPNLYGNRLELVAINLKTIEDKLA